MPVNLGRTVQQGCSLHWRGKLRAVAQQRMNAFMQINTAEARPRIRHKWVLNERLVLRGHSVKFKKERKLSECGVSLCLNIADCFERGNSFSGSRGSICFFHH